METRILATEDAPNKLGAYLDARARSTANATHYTQHQRTRIERLKVGLELVYEGEFYVVYGKTGCGVKIHNAQVSDAKSLVLLESQYATEGIIKKVTAQGVKYHVKKA